MRGTYLGERNLGVTLDESWPASGKIICPAGFLEAPTVFFINVQVAVRVTVADSYIVLYCLYLYPGFYSYTEEATWKILDLLTETLLI